MWMNTNSIKQFYQEAKDKESAITYLAKTNECLIEKIRLIIFGNENANGMSTETSENSTDLSKKGGEGINENSNLDNDKIQQLYDTGMSDAEIARSMAVHHMVVISWRKKRGLSANGVPQNKKKLSKKHKAIKEYRPEYLEALRPLLAMCKQGDSDNVKAGYRILATALLEQELERAFNSAVKSK